MINKQTIPLWNLDSSYSKSLKYILEKQIWQNIWLHNPSILIGLSIYTISTGKVFPKLKRKGSRLSNIVQSGGGSTGSTSSTSSTDDDEATDYVFRIVTTFRPDIIRKSILVFSDIGILTLNPVHGEVYLIQDFVIKFVSDLWQVGGFLRVLRFPPPIKMTATI